MSVEDYKDEGKFSDRDLQLPSSVKENTCLNDQGRLIVPAVCNDSVIHRLPNIYNLVYNILKT